MGTIETRMYYYCVLCVQRKFVDKWNTKNPNYLIYPVCERMKRNTIATKGIEHLFHFFITCGTLKNSDELPRVSSNLFSFIEALKRLVRYHRASRIKNIFTTLNQQKHLFVFRKAFQLQTLRNPI